MEAIFIGRQPIFDRNGQVYGYELLHRRSGEDHAVIDDGDRISADMLINAVLEVGLEQISGVHRAFINVTEKLLKSAGIDALPSDRVVLEVLENVPVDDALLARLAVLHHRHFEIALDDFVALPSRDALIDHADIVKLDVLALEAAELERQTVALKKRGVRLLGEKVESHAMHARLMALGFDLFQGYFFARPETYTSRKIAPNKLVVLEVLASVNQPDVTPQQVSKIIHGDVSMSVTLLRWANGSLYELKHPVESVERAIIVLGLQTIRNWVTLMVMSRMGVQPSELITTLLVRARTCELMADAAGRPNASAFFTVGLLSGLDIILNVEMSRALDHMSLGDEQKAALLSRQGDFGRALDAAIALERGEAGAQPCLALSVDRMRECHLGAIAWTNQVSTAGL